MSKKQVEFKYVVHNSKSDWFITMLGFLFICFIYQEMAFMSWIEVECWTQKQNSENEIKVAVLPIGATEQHGPTGLTGYVFIKKGC